MCGKLLGGPVQVGISRARIGNQVVKGDETRALGAAQVVVVHARVRIPELPVGVRAHAGGIEGPPDVAAEFTEIASAFERGGHARLVSAQRRRARAIVIEEEKRLVVFDGPADGSAKVVQFQRRNGNARGIVEEIVGIHNGVAQKVVTHTVDIICPRTNDHVDNRGARETILRAEIRLLHHELLNRIDRGRVKREEDAAVLLEVGSGDTIHQDVGGSVARAVGDEIVGGAKGTNGVHFRHPRGEHYEVRH